MDDMFAGRRHEERSSEHLAHLKLLLTCWVAVSSISSIYIGGIRIGGEDRTNVSPIKGEISVDWEASLGLVNGKLETVPRYMNALRGDIKISLSHSEHGPRPVDVEVEVDIFKSKIYVMGLEEKERYIVLSLFLRQLFRDWAWMILI
ncbi:32897_t:CDS:2, partial [Racocetra persica]